MKFLSSSSAFDERGGFSDANYAIVTCGRRSSSCVAADDHFPGGIEAVGVQHVGVQPLGCCDSCDFACTLGNRNCAMQAKDNTPAL